MTKIMIKTSTPSGVEVKEWDDKYSLSFYESRTAEDVLSSIEDALKRALQANHATNYGISAEMIGIAMSLLPTRASSDGGGYVIHWGEVIEGWAVHQ